MMSDRVIASFKETVAELSGAGGPFALREIDFLGRKVKVFGPTPKNLPAAFTTLEARFAERVFLVEPGKRSLTFAETFSAARRLAAVLQNIYGVRRGDRVGIIMRNRPEWFISFFATQHIGAIAVLFNGRSGPDDLGAAMERVDCRVVVADDVRAAVVRQSDSRTPIIMVDDMERPISLPNATAFEDVLTVSTDEAVMVDSEPDAPAAILFTSGTTGRSKGATLTHIGLTTLLMSVQFAGAVTQKLEAKELGASPAAATTPPPYAALIIFPMFHVGGLLATLGALNAGGKMVLMRRWRADDAMQLIAEHQVTGVTGPPLVIEDLLSQPGASEKLRNVNRVLAGGQAVPLSMVERVNQVVPHARQGTGYGATETTGIGSGATGLLFQARPASCGLPWPITEVRVVDEAGQELSNGEIGEFQFRGAHIMRDYWDDPEGTRAALDDGWYRTGDLGYRDPDGFLFVVDRRKDMVISAGENIYSAEIEQVLLQDPALLEVAMFGVPDGRLGERAVVAANLRPGEMRTEEQVKARVAAALASYKVPSEVVFDLGPLPRNATGKVDKRRLRTCYLERNSERA